MSSLDAVPTTYCGTNMTVSNVFICAEKADRIKRIAKRYDLTEKKAWDRIRKTDRERKFYYETYTGLEWGSIYSHQALLNASLLGIDKIVDLLEAGISRMKRKPQERFFFSPAGFPFNLFSHDIPSSAHLLV